MSLYRFSEKRYLDGFIQGRLSFAMASSYEDVKLTDAQRDDEQARTFNPDLKKHGFVINGMPIKMLKSVEVKHTARDIDGKKLNYYLMSFNRAAKQGLPAGQAGIDITAWLQWYLGCLEHEGQVST